AGPFHSGEDFEKGWKLAKELNVPIIDEHYYTDPKWFLNNNYRYDSYDRKGSKVYLGEYASWGNKMINAIAEAAFLTSLERNGDVVHMASYAPLLAKKNFTQWKTDMIFFDNVNLCPTPNYFVQKMFMNNQGDLYFEKIITKDTKDSTLAASCVVDTSTGDIILKMVNAGNEGKNMKVDLSRFVKFNPIAEMTLLKGSADAENTFENKQNVKPETSVFNIDKKFNYSAPAMSLTVIRIKTRNN
ncbi:MAG: alpha-L-arabinofuranosidase, partial [Prolixibacteraceae bacterium]|nr:alpha-L-arabinofuranosidase [Prolixibacteraceae bacterium]